MRLRSQFTSRIPQLPETERLILSLLHEREQFALRLADRSGGSLKRGTVYITLQRMQSKGYVDSRLDAIAEGAKGRPRRWYRPSAYGRQVFAAWQLAERALRDRLPAASSNDSAPFCAASPAHHRAAT
jgi:DNA-binding PadR family transcriptional regulator